MAYTKRKCLSLRPIPAAIQRVAVYETRTWLYVVGSTNDGTSCRLLKIDRSPPSPANPRLNIIDTDTEYSEREIKELLIMLDDGNKYAANKFKSQHGLKQVASAFGIIGFLRFLEGYYIVLVTKRKPVASLGGHTLYKIEDSIIYPISFTTSKPNNPDEGRYLKIFQNVDLSSNFYFSYSYDMTLTLQCQMRSYPGPAPPSCRKFIWNDNMLREFEGFVHTKWVLHIVHGFVGQHNISVFGRPIYLTMIARRSKEFAGTRFLKRGANDEGHVANEVETEQIVHDAGCSFHSNGRYTSFLQLRGSVPSYWSQDITTIRPKPQIIIDRATPFASPAASHFMACLKRFGSPVICLNLVKKRERRPRESMLTTELQRAILYLNQFLPPEHHIIYIHKDMARINRSKKQDLIKILENIAADSVKANGFFHGGPELECSKIHRPPNFKEAGGYGYRDDYIGRDQTGILRVNCVDCLDRTNTAQYIAGKCALGYQFYALGVLPEPVLPFDCEASRLLEEIYEDLGDTLAVQYGGSQLVHRIQTYRKVAPMATHGRDIYQTIQRYYRNAFTDADKQAAINVFLGVFQPEPSQPNIWELQTDYYIHHISTCLAVPSKSMPSHTKWWTDRLLASLPLPQNEVDDEDDPEAPSPKLSELTNTDSFDEVYKPFELTDFDSLLAKNIGRPIENDPRDASPFTVKSSKNRKLPALKQSVKSKTVRVVVGGAPKSNADADSSSGGTSSGEEEDENSAPSLATHSTHSRQASPLPSGPVSSMQAYGFELHEPSVRDSLLYERYARLHNMMCMPSTRGMDAELSSDAVNAELAQWEPTYDYKEDSVFCIEPPEVSPQDERIYERSVAVMTMGPLPPPQASLELYNQYAKMACR
jgi:hypothetical protein